jgi:hypothetical protein
LITWYISTGTFAVPGLPVAAPVAVEWLAALGLLVDDGGLGVLPALDVLLAVDPHAASPKAATTDASAARP